MKGIKFFIGCLFVWGALISLVSCSKDAENLGMYSDEEFHNKVVQIQNKYNSSLKIDESCLRKDDETLTNINDIMRTIENSGFDYELITSEEGGLIAMPILSTTATRSNSSEMDSGTFFEILTHSALPCEIEISGIGQDFQVKPCREMFYFENISCGGTVTRNYIRVQGDIKIRQYSNSADKLYYINRRKDSSQDIFEVIVHN